MAFLGFMAILAPATMLVVEQVKRILKFTDETPRGYKYVVAALISIAMPLVIALGGESIIELLLAYLGESVVITPPTDFPTAGVVLASFMNFLLSGGLYNWLAEAIKGKK